MSWDAWLTLAVLVVMVAVLARDVVAPSVAVIGAVISLLVAGVIDPSQAFAGFSNPAPITVAALYVVARAVEKTGVLQPVVSATLGEGRSVRRALGRLLLPSATASAFLNNTPIVAMLVPQVTDWADRRGLSPSHFLMPLSFAAMLGGMVTLIGSSTNLVVSGLLQAAGHPPLGMFELSRVGVPIALAGLVLLVLLTPVLLRERRGARREFAEDVREFVVAMEVVPGGPLDLRAVSEGGLRNLRGVFLVEIHRGEEVIAPVAPETVLHGGDHLTFAGRADDVLDLQSIRGLTSREQEHLDDLDTPRHTFFEAVVGPTSPLVGSTLKEIGFRGRYQAAVVAVHRAGQRVRAKLGSIRLRPADTLLLLADPGFRERWRDRNLFVLVSRLGGTAPAVTRKAPLVGLIVAAMVTVAATGVLPVTSAALLAALLLVVVGVLMPGEARNAVDLDVILVIAGAFGLAAALDLSGLAERGASVLTVLLEGLGPRAGMAGIAVITVGLVAIITRNAAAVLMFPVAMATAEQLGVDQRPFAVVLALAASASFLTPIAYQTNLMVYGPGGYQFGDYPRLGLALASLVIGMTVWLVPLFWPL